jgi:hypothetical protein
MACTCMCLSEREREREREGEFIRNETGDSNAGVECWQRTSQRQKSSVEC